MLFVIYHALQGANDDESRRTGVNAGLEKRRCEKVETRSAHTLLSQVTGHVRLCISTSYVDLDMGHRVGMGVAKRVHAI